MRSCHGLAVLFLLTCYAPRFANTAPLFESSVIYTPLPAFDTGLEAGDFDGDGRVDLLVSDAPADKVRLLRGMGDGTFQLAQELSAAWMSGPRSLAVGDVNEDGFSDAVCSN